jgi:type IV pilus assembly protein PilN
MIRINLLPQKGRRPGQVAAQGSQLWLVLIMAVVALEIVACFFIYSGKQEELARHKKKNTELQVQIDQAKNAVKDHDKIKAKLEQLRAREAAIAKLESARTGPTAMLLEVARILTSGRGPTVDADKLAQVRRENPLAVYNPNWDARRLWLRKFVEDQRTIVLEGQARDAEDVSEIARRMTLSSYFYDVKLQSGSKEVDSKSKLALLKFQLQAKVRY